MSNEHVVTEAEMAWKWVEGEVEAKGYCCLTASFYNMLGGLKQLLLLLEEHQWAVALRLHLNPGPDTDEYVVYRRKA